MLKSKIAGFLGLLIALGIGFYLLDPGKKGREGEHTVMTLMITFVPDLVVEPVSIEVRFNGKARFNEVADESPWTDVVNAPPGVLVSLVTLHAFPLNLSCKITSKGVTYGPNRAKPSSSGGHTCVVMATA